MSTNEMAATSPRSPEALSDWSSAAQPQHEAPQQNGFGKPYRDILKHSSIYGLGALLSRFASFLLLPFYTSYLRPADYGCIALLDLTSSVLGIFITAGIASAVTRYHFEADDGRERNRVWWTGLTIVTLMATGMVAPAWLVRDSLAHFTLGPGQVDGGYYYQLILITLWFDAIGQVLDAFPRVRKWSVLFAGCSFLSLLINIGLNIFFLAGLGLGVAGMLLGNLISCALRRFFLFAVLMYNSDSYAFDRPLGAKLLRFGGPLILTAILTLIMKQADRYLLHFFVSMDQVGIYSVATSIGWGLYMLFIVPFNSIWGVVIYEIADQPHAKKIHAQIFQYFVYCQMLLFFAVSLVAGPLLALVAAPDYAEAAPLIPIVCLAYLFFSMHDHFKVPAFLAKRTLSLLPAFVTAAGTNIVGNLCLIPILGPAGAAWVSVLTFAIFSFLGLWRYRLIDKYPYPLFRCGVVLLGLVGTYGASSLLYRLHLSGFWLLAILLLIWSTWVVLLLGPGTRRLKLLRPAGLRES